MKALKVIAGLALAVVILVVVGGYLLVSNLDGIIKDVIEDVGSEITQASVTVNAVNLDLKTGKGQIKGLTIGNPEGFDSKYAFRLENVALGLDLKTLSAPVIVITEITIRGAKLIAEQKGKTTNLSVLMKNMEASSKKASSEPSQPQGTSDPTDVRLMVKKFVFVNTKGTIIPEGSKKKALKLPDVRRKNIGNNKTGLTPEQLANELLQSVIEQVEKAVADYLAGLAVQAVENKIKEKLGLGSKDTE
jgi:hypothetical protein